MQKPCYNAICFKENTSKLAIVKTHLFFFPLAFLKRSHTAGGLIYMEYNLEFFRIFCEIAYNTFFERV